MADTVTMIFIANEIIQLKAYKTQTNVPNTIDIVYP